MKHGDFSFESLSKIVHRDESFFRRDLHFVPVTDRQVAWLHVKIESWRVTLGTVGM